MAGGDTEVGGNGSVYWRSSHYDNKNNKRKLKYKDRDGAQNNDEIDFGKDECGALGRDADTNVSEVGARLGHKGFFLVTLRYKTLADAQAAGEWVASNVKPAAGGYYLSILVPSIKTRETPQDDPPFEVKVQW